MTGHLLHEPHHDGSPLYLSDEAPAQESGVAVRLRTDPGDPVEAVWIRTTYDGEPVYHPCRIPEPGPSQPRTHVPDPQENCPLERVGAQLVRCDDLTGAGAHAPWYVPVRGSR